MLKIAIVVGLLGEAIAHFVLGFSIAQWQWWAICVPWNFVVIGIAYTIRSRNIISIASKIDIEE